MSNFSKKPEDERTSEPDATFDEPPVYDDDDPPIEPDDEPSLWDDMRVRPTERATTYDEPDREDANDADEFLDHDDARASEHEATPELPDEPPLDREDAAPPSDPDAAGHDDSPIELFASDPAPDEPAREPRPVAPPLEVQIAALLADPHKRIVGDLQWSAEEDGAQGREFLAPVRCAGGELRVRGQRCAAAGTLRFSLISRGVGRIAALDVGHAHQAADGRRSGETHFHRRDRRDHPTRDLEPLAPDDLAGAWRLFCALTNITHEGALADPPPVQETLL